MHADILAHMQACMLAHPSTLAGGVGQGLIDLVLGPEVLDLWLAHHTVGTQAELSDGQLHGGAVGTWVEGGVRLWVRGGG